MPLDLTLLSLHRLNGQELPSLPGLMAVTPSRKAARGRERDALIVALLLTGNTPFSTGEYMQLASEAASAYYNTPGALTSALRVAAEAVNRLLLERNLAASGRGQYVVGALTLAALRDTQLTLLQSGPTHVLIVSSGETRHLHDPTRSGKGLGLNPTISQYFSQAALQPGDRLVLGSKIAPAWESALASDRGLPALESTRKRMMTLIEGDVSAVLIQAAKGTGKLTILRAAEDKPASHPSRPVPGEAAPRVRVPPPVLQSLPALKPATSSPTPGEADSRGSIPESSTPPPPSISPLPNPPTTAAHVVGRPPEEGPSAYAIPPQPVLDDEAIVEQLAEAAMARQFPPSIPRLKPIETQPETSEAEAAQIRPDETVPSVAGEPAKKEPSPLLRDGTRLAARLAVGGIQVWRRVSERVGAVMKKFLPRLLPDGESASAISSPSTATMAFIAIAVPIIIATIGIVVYLSTGVSSQYENYLAQAKALRAQAVTEIEPVQQRKAWDNVLQRVAEAESFDETPETIALRQEAQTNLDKLLGVTRLNYTAVFASPLDVEISRLAASETDLYMLDAQQGRVLRAAQTSRGYEQDTTFDCAPGNHGDATTGPMVDLLTLPRINTLNSSMLGVDAAGNLLYCSPGQVPLVMPLTPPSTGWGRVTAMTMDGNKLYVLDASSSAVWVYEGKDSTFPDPPIFFFGTQIPNIQDAIDIQVNGDELYLLHADGHLTHCTFSRVESVSTSCTSPVPLTNPFPAYGEIGAFAGAHFTQMALATLPEPTLLLLDADGRAIFRISLRTNALLSIFGANTKAADPLSRGTFSAMTLGPNQVLYVAHDGQVYFTNEVP